MRSVLGRHPLSYPVTTYDRWHGSASAPVGLHLKPGQRGTKRLLAEYGDRLVCVRYRYDTKRKKRFKTVELLVAERDWQPRPPRLDGDPVVGLRIAFSDVAVRRVVKQAGAEWNPEQRVWQLPYRRVVALGLTGRIADDLASTSGCATTTGKHPDPDAQRASR